MSNSRIWLRVLSEEALDKIAESAYRLLDEVGISLQHAVAKEMLQDGRFVKPEGHLPINVKTAVQTFKELKILRPVSGETPFAQGEIGDRIYRYLESAVNMKKN